MKDLVKQYGLPLALYYFIFNETCVVLVTCGLYYDWLGGGDIVSFLHYIGASKYVDIDAAMSKSVSLGPFGELEAKLAAHFGLATVFMSLFTPIQLPFCIATLPRLKKLFKRKM